MPEQVIEIPLDEILEDRPLFQRNNQHEGVQQLASSIELCGQLVPIIVMEDPAGWRIVDGNHRLEAARLLSRPTIRAIVVEEADIAHAAMVNSYQQPFDAISRLRLVEKLLETNPSAHWRDIALPLKIAKAEASKYMRMARAVPEVRQRVDDDRNSMDGISMGVLRELAYQDEARQVPLLEQILDKQRATKRRLTRQGFMELLDDQRGHAPADGRFQAFGERLTEMIGVPVELRRGKGKRQAGHLTFRTPSADASDQMLEFLEKVLEAHATPAAPQAGRADGITNLPVGQLDIRNDAPS